MFEILYTSQALRSISKTNRSIQRRLKFVIEERLATAPDVYGKPLKYSMKGLRSLRAGDYRVIYLIRGHSVIIADAGHRRDVYE